MSAAEGEQAFTQEVKASDIERDWVAKGTDIVKVGLTQCKSEKALASYIKNEFDKAFSSFGWNVVVGKSFGSYVFHKTKMYMYLSVRDMHILIWQS